MNLYRSPFVLGAFILCIGCSTSTQQKEDKTLSTSPTINPIADQDEVVKDSRGGPLLLSKDYGQTWLNVSDGLPPEASVSFMESYGNEMILATDNLGVFVSNDHRTSWKHVGNDLPNAKINALHVSGNLIWIGVYREGIFESKDGGATWRPMNNGLSNLNIQAIHKFGDTLFVGTDAGIYKKAKNEKSWKPTSISNQVLSIYKMEDILIAGTSIGTAISKDMGTSWNWIRQEGAVHYTHPAGNAIVELCLNGDLYFSYDMGSTWIESNYTPRTGSYVYEIASIDNYLLISNNYGIHRSADNGRHWEHVFKTESVGFFDFLVIGKEIYGGTRVWDEYRGRK